MFYNIGQLIGQSENTLSQYNETTNAMTISFSLEIIKSSFHSLSEKSLYHPLGRSFSLEVISSC